jgi:hypothetical protein
MSLGFTQPVTNEYQEYLQGLKVAGAFPLSCANYLGALTSQNPQGLSRPVMGLLYLFFVINNYFVSPEEK